VKNCVIWCDLFLRNTDTVFDKKKRALFCLYFNLISLKKIGRERSIHLSRTALFQINNRCGGSTMATRGIIHVYAQSIVEP
jgi:hypothetical protein